MNVVPGTAKLIEDALAIIEPPGAWCRGALHLPARGPGQPAQHCAVGALNRAWTGKPERRGAPPGDSYKCATRLLQQSAASHYPVANPFRHGEASLVTINNCYADHAGIIAIFRDAAAVAREHEPLAPEPAASEPSFQPQRAATSIACTK